MSTSHLLELHDLDKSCRPLNSWTGIRLDNEHYRQKHSPFFGGDNNVQAKVGLNLLADFGHLFQSNVSY